MDDSDDWQAICDHIVNHASASLLSNSKFSTPSALRLEFQKSIAIFNSNVVERDGLVNSLKSFVETSQQIANLFSGSFIRRFSNELLAFYLKCMVNKGPNNAECIPLSTKFVVTGQKTDSMDFKQLMHYVGGSNIKSILRTAFRIKNPNHEWLRVIKAVKDYFLVSELAQAPDEEIMAWTLSQDRGGLTKICGSLLEFFVELGATVKVLEHFDGSLYVEEVIEKVTNSSKLICMWDMTLNGALTSQESFKLLHAICSYFCNTWRRGIVTRRLDELCSEKESVGAKHGMAGVAFRATLH